MDGQLFGFIMGLGMGWVFLSRLKNSTELEKEHPSHWLQMGAHVFLLILMFWANLHKNVRSLRRDEAIPETFIGVGAGWVVLLIAVIISIAVIVGLARSKPDADQCFSLGPRTLSHHLMGCRGRCPVAGLSQDI